MPRVEAPTDKRTAPDRARDLLEQIEYPWHVNFLTTPGENPALATIRKPDGFPAVMPHPEAQSMLTSTPATLQFIADAPELIQELLDIIDGLSAGKVENKDA